MTDRRYRADFTPFYFDLVINDEAHRSIWAMHVSSSNSFRPPVLASPLPRQPHRRRRTIDAWIERRSAKICRNRRIARLACESVVRSGDIILSPERHRIGEVCRSYHQPGRKASHRAPVIRRDAKISGDDGRAGIGHCRGSQDPEAIRLARFGAVAASVGEGSYRSAANPAATKRLKYFHLAFISHLPSLTWGPYPVCCRDSAVRPLL